MKTLLLSLTAALAILPARAQPLPGDGVPAPTQMPVPATPETPPSPPTASDLPPAPVSPSLPAEPLPPETQLQTPASPPEPSPAPIQTPAPQEPPPPLSIPNRGGDTSGPAWIGHRAVVDRYAGWGWVKKEGDSWRRGQWVLLEEQPGSLLAPGHSLGKPSLDDDNEYRLFGDFAPYKGYEPNYDVLVAVFRLKGFEHIGPGPRPDLKPPRSSNAARSNPTSRSRGIRDR